MPDLVVVDPRHKGIELVEVKYRNKTPSWVGIATSKLTRIKKFWPTTILAWILPCDHVFYACRVNELKIDPNLEITNLNLEDSPIDSIFPMVANNGNLERLQKLAVNMLKGIDLGAKLAKE
jgi:tRNA A22 N-methylase